MNAWLRLGVLLGGLLGALASAPPASAASVPLGSHDDIEVGAWIEGGATTPTADEPGNPRPYLSKARLVGRYRHDEVVSALLQVDVVERVTLLDAVVELHPTADVTLRAGRFKTPVSREFQEPGTELLFVHRPATTGVTPGRRVGAEIAWTPQLGEVEGRVQVGLFDDAAEGFAAHGPVAVVRTGAELQNGLGLHAAVARPLAPGEGADPTVLDAALTFERGPARVLAEGAVSLGPFGPTGAAVLQGGWRFGDEGGVGVEPTLGFDMRAAPGASLHPRLMTGVNLDLANGHLIPTVDLVIERHDGAVAPTVLVQLRALL